MAQSAGFGDVLRISEFRALWAAEILSKAGDQLARVALAVLVYQQTSSATLTALTYGLTFLPALVGGALLSGLADRFPRRDLMVAVDICRTALAGLIALPGTPLPLLCMLVFVLSLANAPYKAAQLALLPQILDGERYPLGLAVRTTTGQLAQLVGFAGGGALVALLNPHAALALNAGTFAVAALLVRVGVASREAPRRGQIGDRPSTPNSMAGGARLIWRSPRLRSLVAITWLVGLYVVPEALAAPYATELAAGAAAVGLLLAADPLGSAVGSLAFTRLVPAERRPRLIGALAVLGGVPLALCMAQPGLVVSLVLFAISGAFSTAYLIQTQASFVPLVPDDMRGQAIGLVSAGMMASQGVALMLAGLVADAIGVTTTIAAAGVLSAALAAGTGLAWHRAHSRPPVAWKAGNEHGTDRSGQSHVPTTLCPASSDTASAPPPSSTTPCTARSDEP